MDCPNLVVSVFKGADTYRGTAQFSGGSVKIQNYEQFAADMQTRFRIEKGKVLLEDINLRSEGALVELDAVGGTVLLVRADLHRDGLVFPPVPYGRHNPRVRSGLGELETEGLGILAREMGHIPWGMPHLEVRHARH